MGDATYPCPPIGISGLLPTHEQLDDIPDTGVLARVVYADGHMIGCNWRADHFDVMHIVAFRPHIPRIPMYT